jgi:hypothetical protein
MLTILGVMMINGALGGTWFMFSAFTSSILLTPFVTLDLEHYPIHLF